MKFKFMVMLATLFVVSIVASGCTERMMDFTVISTKNVPISMPAKTTQVVGEDKVIMIFAPFGVPSLKEAIDDALEKSSGNVLVNVRIYSDSKILLFFGKFGYRVIGESVDFSSISETK